ncbi:MAG: hypothetical protein ABH843_06275, partial [Candidatus Omnitrophota bacterium]
MNRSTYMIIGILAVSLTGCVTVEKVVRERADQDVSGNKGYIQGSIAEVDEGAKPIEREYIDIKFELPNLGEIKDNLP